MNKSRSVFVYLLLSVVVLVSAEGALGAVPKNGDRVPGVLIVQFSQDFVPQYNKQYSGNGVMGVSSLDAINSQYDLVSYARLFPHVEPPVPPRNLPDLTRYHILHFREDVDLDEVAAAYSADPNVASVEFDTYALMEAIPNDSLFSQMWNLRQVSDHDVDADQAWDVTTGSQTVILGVTDTGVLYNHEDLQGSIWVNPGEDLDSDGVVFDPDDMNGIDDDGNGYVDDLIGWDFVEAGTDAWPGEDGSVADNDPKDFNGHGTHTSGTIAAMTNNSRGVSGLAGGFGPGRPGCKVMCLRMGWSFNNYGTEGGVTQMSYVAEAFVYAASMGARAINYSFGSGTGGGIEAATNYAVAHGVTICAAAGNSASSSGFGYLQSRPDVVCVAATDQYDGKSYFSNYGPLVDISAPGSDIWSTVSYHYTPGYAVYSGTSMAAPHVVGLTGLILSVNPGLTRTQVLEVIQSTADSTTSYVGEMGAGRINAYKAVLAAKAFRISHVPLVNTADTLNPYQVVTTIVSDTTLKTDSLSLFYRSSAAADTSYIRVPLLPTGGLNEYAASIPAQPVYSVIEYGLTAEDDRGERMTSPATFPLSVYSFRILGIPVLFSHPDSFHIELPSGYTEVETLVVRNDGTDDLLFTMGIRGLDTAVFSRQVWSILQANEAVVPSRDKTAYRGQTLSPSTLQQLTADQVLARRARYPSSSLPAVRAVVLDSWGTEHGSYTDWNYLNANYGDFGSTPVIIDYSTFNHENITYAELAASNADVLIVSDAWSSGYGWEFTPAEMAAIRQYVEEGHGLFVTAGTLDFENAPSHMAAFASLLGLDSTVSYQWSSAAAMPQNLLVANHPLFKNVPDPYVASFDVSVRPLDRVWSAAVADGELIASSVGGTTATTTYRNRVYSSIMPEEVYWTGQTAADDQFVYNAIVYCASSICDWLSVNPVSGSVPPHDSVLVDVRFDAGLFHQDTTLACQINLMAQDSLGSRVQIPVRMHVLPPDHYVDLSPKSAAKSGAARDTVWYADTLTNFGALDDFYHLDVTHAQWPTTVWDSAGTAPIATTPVMSMNDKYVIRPRVIIPDTAVYGQQDTLHLIVRSDGDPVISQTFEAITGSAGRPDSIPWFDPFISTTLDTLHWQFSRDVNVNDIGIGEPSPPYSLDLNAYPNSSDMVTSVPFNLKGQIQVVLSYWYEQTGGGEEPDPGEDLVFEALDSTGNWLEVSRQYGSGPSMTSFRHVEIILPRGAYHSQFRLRIRSSGSYCQCDDWFVDDVLLYAPIPPSICHAPDDFSFSLPADTQTKDTLVICNNGPGELRFRLAMRDTTAGLAGTSFPRVIPSGPTALDGVAPVTDENSPAAVPQSPSLGSQSMGLSEDFEDGDLNGWTIGSGSYLREVTTATAASGTRYSLRQTGGSQWHYDGVSRGIPAAQYRYVGFYIRASSTSDASGYVVVGDENTTVNNGTIFFLAGPDGRFTVYPGDASFPYVALRWYKVEFYLDWANQTFDYYVDGNLIAHQLPFRNYTSHLSQIHLYNYDYTTAWWDQLGIGDGPTSGGWLSFAPSADTLAPGETTLVDLTISANKMGSGDYRKIVAINSNDPYTPLIDVPVALRVKGPEILVVPDSIADSLAERGSVDDTIWVHNIGEEPLRGKSLATSQDWLSLHESPYFMVATIDHDEPSIGKFVPAGVEAAGWRHSRPGLAPGDSTPIIVTVAGEDLIAGNHCGEILIRSNDFDEGEFRVPICVHVGPDPDVSVTPESLMAALNPGDSMTLPFQIANDGGGTLQFGIGTRSSHSMAADVLRTLRSRTVHGDGVFKSPPRNSVTDSTHRSSMAAMVNGDFLAFDITERGEIMPFQYPPGQEHLAIGSWLSGYTVAYRAAGIDHLAYAYYDRRSELVPVSRRVLRDDANQTTIEVVIRTADNMLRITRLFDSDKHDKYVRIHTTLENTSGSPLSDVLFKSGADWDMDGNPGDDSWNFDSLRIMEYAYNQHYASIVPSTPPSLLDVDGWGDYSQRETSPDAPPGPYSYYDGFLILDYTIGTLGAGHAADVFDAYVAGDNLADLQGVADRAAAGVSWLTFVPDSGRVAPSSATTVEALFRSLGLARPDFYAEGIIVSNDPDEDTVTLPVHMHLKSPEISLRPESLFIEATEGMTSDSILWVINHGDGDMHFTIGADPAQLSSIPASGTVSPAESLGVIIRADASGLIPGMYDGEVTVLSDDFYRPKLVVPVAVRVGPDPDVVVTPDSFSIVVNTGDSLHTPLLIENRDLGTLAYGVQVEMGENAVSRWQQVRPAQIPVGKTSMDVIAAPATPPATYGTAASTRRFALFQDSDPWGSYQMRGLLDAHGIAYDIWGTGSIGAVDLSQYDKVIIASVQSSNFYSTLSAHRAWFEDYAQSGGHLEMHLANYYYGLALPLPGGFEINPAYCLEYVNIVDSAHPILTTPNLISSAALNYWGCSAHGYLTSVPPGTRTILTSADYGTPICAEVSFGAGSILATSQPVESYWAYFPYLENMLLYNSIRAPWLTIAPDSGLVPPKSSVVADVRVVTKNLMVLDSYARLLMRTNDPDRSSFAVPVHLHIRSPEIRIDPDDTLSIAATEGAVTTDTVWVFNVGDADLHVGGSADSVWTSVLPLSATVPPGDSVALQVRVEAGALLPGNYSDRLTVNSDDTRKAALQVMILVHVGPDPRIVLPDSLIVTIARNDSALFPVSVSNIGLGTLWFRAEPHVGIGAPSRAGGRYPNSYYQPLGKGEADHRVGQPVAFGKGGPDSAGYRWIDSDEPGGPVFQWVDIAATGTLVTGLYDDNYVGPFPVGFAFPYYDSSYAQFWISSNGFIGFGPPYGYSNLGHGPIPSSYDPNNMIAWCQSDLYPAEATYPTRVYYRNEANRLVVQFDRVRHCCNDGPWITAEIILDQSGQIMIQYREIQLGFNSEYSTVGIEDQNGFRGLEVAFNTPYAHDSLAVRISKIPPWLSVVPDTGRVAPAGSTLIDAHVNGTDLSERDYLGEILFVSNDPLEPLKTLPVRLSVVSPQIAIRPDSIHFEAPEGEITDSTLWINNWGSGDLRVVLKATDSTVSAVPDSTILSPGDSLMIAVRVDARHLIPGWYSSTLGVRSNDPNRPVLSVPLVIHVGPDPQIVILPESLVVSVVHGDGATARLGVENTGLGTLAFTTRIKYSPLTSGATVAGHYPPAYYSPIGKGEPDPRSGRPVTLGSGGPDSAGYQWIDSDDPDGPVFQWTDISGTGTPVIGLSDDNTVGPFPIGFNFQFYDSAYSQFWISSNGFIGFGPPSGYSSWTNTPLPAADTPNNLIAWFWDDLFTRGAGLDPTQVFYLNEPDRVIVQFTRVRDYCCPGGPWITAEIILQSNGRITIQYADVQPGFLMEEATVGIENGTGTTGLEVAFNTSYVHASLAILISRSQVDWLTLNPESALVPPDVGAIVRAECKTGHLDLGDYHARISFLSNDPVRDTVVIPVHMKVTKSLTETASMPGDLNGDGIADLYDLQTLVNSLFPASDRPDRKGASLRPSGLPLQNADFNRDGVTDIRDAVLLIRAIWREDKKEVTVQGGGN